MHAGCGMYDACRVMAFKGFAAWSHLLAVATAV